MNKKGFTLVELLIVIAILGILAAILIPGIAHIAGSGGSGTSKIVEYQQPASIEVTPVKEPIVNNSKDVSCIIPSCVDGKKVIKINDKVFYLGTIKNSWGDLEPVKCQ